MSRYSNGRARLTVLCITMVFAGTVFLTQWTLSASTLPEAEIAPAPAASQLSPRLFLPSVRNGWPPADDPDGDGYTTYFETVWGTDPMVFTTFEELSYHPGTTWVKMRVAHPFSTLPGSPSVVDLAELNNTVYQVVSPDYMIDDWRTPEDPTDDHLIFEAVLFPYAKEDITPMKVDSFPINPSAYPREVWPYLVAEEDDICNITPDLRATMLAIVNGTGEGYSTPAKTDVEAVDRIQQWNLQNLQEIWDTEYWINHFGDPCGCMPYERINTHRTGTMFAERTIRASTMSAAILNAELRAIGIPSRLVMHVSAECNVEHPGCEHLKGMNHPQNGIFFDGHWTIRDYNYMQGIDAREDPHWVSIDAYRDTSDAIFDYWYYVIDTGHPGGHPFGELYYLFERREN